MKRVAAFGLAALCAASCAIPAAVPWIVGMTGGAAINQGTTVGMAAGVLLISAGVVLYLKSRSRSNCRSKAKEQP